MSTARERRVDRVIRLLSNFFFDEVDQAYGVLIARSFNADGPRNEQLLKGVKGYGSRQEAFQGFVNPLSGLGT
jgi:hypothetical protein